MSIPQTTVTLYLENLTKEIVPPEPILVDEQRFVRAGLAQGYARLFGFRHPNGLLITKWWQDALADPDEVQGLHPLFIISGHVWVHPLPISEIRIRESEAKSIQVVITDSRDGKSYRPYVGGDQVRAQRIATSWGQQPHFTVAVTPAAS